MNRFFAPRAPRAPRALSTRSSPSALGTLAVAALLACTAGTTRAETSPYAVGVSQTLSQESNPLRVRDALAQDELVSTTALNFLLDQPIGRQRLKANATLEAERYSETGAWDNNPYRLGAELDWETANRWQGELGLDTGRELYRQDQNTLDPEPNQQRSSRAWLRARVGVITTWTFEAGLTAYDRDLSLAAFDRLDQQQWAGEAGVRYRFNPDLGARLMLRHTDGEYPNYDAAGADEFRRNDLELAVDWRITGASAVDARVSWGRETHTRQDSRDADLWTGLVRWRWEPTGKLMFTTSLQRDSDVGASRFGSDLIDPGSIVDDETTDARLSTTLALAAKWAATAKITVDAVARHTRRELENDGGAGSSQRGNDNTTTLSLGARYSPTRAIDLGCLVSRERRSTSTAIGGLSYPYGNTAFSCFGQFWLR